MLDVFSSRQLTQQTVANGFRWTASEVLPDRPEILEAEEPDEIIMATGGLYELIYQYLEQGKTPDVAKCALPSTLVFAHTFGVDVPPEGLEAYAIAPDELMRLAQRAARLIP